MPSDAWGGSWRVLSGGLRGIRGVRAWMQCEWQSEGNGKRKREQWRIAVRDARGSAIPLPAPDHSQRPSRFPFPVSPASPPRPASRRFHVEEVTLHLPDGSPPWTHDPADPRLNTRAFRLAAGRGCPPGCRRATLLVIVRLLGLDDYGRYAMRRHCFDLAPLLVAGPAFVYLNSHPASAVPRRPGQCVDARVVRDGHGLRGAGAVVHGRSQANGTNWGCGSCGRDRIVLAGSSR